jgi:hypothetical protein
MLTPRALHPTQSPTYSAQPSGPRSSNTHLKPRPGRPSFSPKLWASSSGRGRAPPDSWRTSGPDSWRTSGPDSWHTGPDSWRSGLDSWHQLARCSGPWAGLRSWIGLESSDPGGGSEAGMGPAAECGGRWGPCRKSEGLILTETQWFQTDSKETKKKLEVLKSDRKTCHVPKLWQTVCRAVKSIPLVAALVVYRNWETRTRGGDTMWRKLDLNAGCLDPISWSAEGLLNEAGHSVAEEE